MLPFIRIYRIAIKTTDTKDIKKRVIQTPNLEVKCTGLIDYTKNIVY